ncbi:hypothetical protein LUZ60_008484 [Juncus effusus]|nr:hypothetical protein LUZ60_008484 [Juncus effusus]
MRPLKESIYEFANASQSLNLYTRIYMGPSIVRYPSDPYDRVWRPVDPGSHWDTISTDKTITNNNNDEFEAPSAALQFAATPANGSRQLKFNWGDGNISTEYYFVFYFSELVDLTSTNDSRIFSIYHSTSSDPLAGPFSPPYLVGFHYSANGFFTGLEYPNISIRATSSSTLPPIINAIEIYSREIPTQPMTDLTDFEAIEGIKKDHGVKKNWMGDPCSPAQYAWDGLMCSFGINSTKIIRVDLSYSKLAGVISNSFASLQSVQVLDLSHNNLIGTVPEFLGNMTSLQVLSLTDNCLGAIPDKLLQKAAAGTLTLRYEPQATSCGASDNPKKKKSTVIIVVIASVIVVAMLLLMIYIRKRRPTATSQDAMISWEIDQTIRFTKSQLEKIIKTFNKRIGAGGFGEVFYGKLENDTEVAIKVLSKTSSQGYKEFKKEVEALPAIYHGNIVKFIGYCEEGEYLALVYEYMPNRSLADQLHGLEYLHTGRQMVHRDVKSANILLDQNFEAKVSDFGMSRIFDENTVTMTQSTIGGTFGYLDPEILTGATKKLSFPSDVYSFGVVLLEIVTGQPPFSQERGSLHIVDYVSQNPTIFDPKMGEYDPESVRKVINLAMQCTKRTSKDRPTMSHVVLELQQCLDMGTSHQWSMSQYSGASSTISKTIPF